MTFTTATQELLALVSSILTLAEADNVVFDNEAYDPVPRQAWTKVSIVHKAGIQETLGHVGARRFEYKGLVAVRSYAPVDFGTSPSAGLFEFFIPYAHVRILDSLRFETPRISEGVREGAWHVSGIEMPFVYENIL